MNSGKNIELLSCIEINPPQNTSASIIWLHGLGASGNDFVPVAAEVSKLSQLSLRYVFPHAPIRAVTLNRGYPMPAWYDIASFDKNCPVDQEGIASSVKQVELLIEQEKQHGFSTEQIFLAGFSQGAVIALSTVLNYPKPLAGIIALSGYLPFKDIPEKKHETPIFIAHGLKDEIVPCHFGELACKSLKKASYSITWYTYPMAHSVSAEEIRDLSNWLKTTCKGTSI